MLSVIETTEDCVVTLFSSGRSVVWNFDVPDNDPDNGKGVIAKTNYLSGDKLIVIYRLNLSNLEFEVYIDVVHRIIDSV